MGLGAVSSSPRETKGNSAGKNSKPARFWIICDRALNVVCSIVPLAGKPTKRLCRSTRSIRMRSVPYFVYMYMYQTSDMT